MSDILADYRAWRQQQAARVSTHSDGCHMWHKECMIHRLADALAVEQAKRTPAEGTRQQRCTLTDAEREAILYCVSCAQDYRDTLDGSEERATQMIETAMRFAMPQVGPAPVEGQRTASVTDVGGAGPTFTDAERQALEIAVEYVGSAYAVEHHAATLRGLLERTR